MTNLQIGKGKLRRLAIGVAVSVFAGAAALLATAVPFDAPIAPPSLQLSEQRLDKTLVSSAKQAAMNAQLAMESRSGFRPSASLRSDCGDDLC